MLYYPITKKIRPSESVSCKYKPKYSTLSACAFLEDLWCKLHPTESCNNFRQVRALDNIPLFLNTVLCITVGGSRNGPPPTTNSPPKSEASSANSISVRTNRFFDFWTLLALYINR